MTPARFERTTYRLGGGCSIQLSYGALFSLPTDQGTRSQKPQQWVALCLERLSRLEEFARIELRHIKRGSAFQKRCRSVSFQQSQINQPHSQFSITLLIYSVSWCNNFVHRPSLIIVISLLLLTGHAFGEEKPSEPSSCIASARSITLKDGLSYSPPFGLKSFENGGFTLKGLVPDLFANDKLERKKKKEINAFIGNVPIKAYLEGTRKPDRYGRHAAFLIPKQKWQRNPATGHSRLERSGTGNDRQS